MDEILIQESRWNDIKYKMSKLGMIKKGGKFFGRKKQDAKARAEFDAMLKDVNNNLVKELNDLIIEKFPEFPNCKSREEFLNGVKAIANVYDAICQACIRTYGAPKYSKKNEYGFPMPILSPEDKMYMDIELANSLIRSLQKYMQKIIDYDLSTSYTIFETCEYDPNEYVELTRLYEELSLNPMKWFKKKPEQIDTKTDQKEIGAGPEQKMIGSGSSTDIATKSKEVGAVDTPFNVLGGGKGTHTKKEVESSKKELIIGGLGAALGVFGWIMQTDWFKHILEGWMNKPQVDVTQVKSSIEEIKFNVAKGDGFTQTINKMCGTNLGPNTTTAEFISAMKEKGFGSSAGEIVKNLGMQSTSPNPNFVSDATSALSQDGPLKSVFSGLMSGKGGSLLALKPGPFLAKKITNTVIKVIAKKAVTTGTATAAKLAGLGSVLAPLGITLIAGAATSYLLKRKAKKSSRFKDLQGLLDIMDELILTKSGIASADTGEIVPFKSVKKKAKAEIKAEPKLLSSPTSNAVSFPVKSKDSGTWSKPEKRADRFAKKLPIGKEGEYVDYEEVKDSKIANFDDFGKIYENKK